MSKRKITDVDRAEIIPEQFEDTESYQRFMIIFDALVIVQRKMDAGFKILDNGSFVQEPFDFSLNDDGFMPCIMNGCIVWCGSTYGLKDNTVYVEDYEPAMLDCLYYISPHDIKRVFE